MYYTSPENIYSQMKMNIENTDTSENSYIYNALYPSAMEIAYCLLMMDQVENKVFASKAVTAGYSDYLELRCNEVGVYRKQATTAKPTVTFTGKVGTKIPMNFIVSTNDNRQYTVPTDTNIGTDGTVDLVVTAADVGSLYNVKAGDINYLPVKISGITSVTNKEEYTDAYDKESDTDLYARYLLKIQKPATSGNISDYQEWCLSITGVGDVTVYPLMDENFQKKNGCVTCVITDSNKEKASDDLIKAVQDYIAPTDNQSINGGQAPIGATVFIRTAENVTVNISANISISSSASLSDVTTKFTTLVQSYLTNVVFTTKQIILKKIEGLLIGIDEVEDCNSVAINGVQDNITLSKIQLAVLGNITLNLM